MGPDFNFIRYIITVEAIHGLRTSLVVVPVFCILTHTHFLCSQLYNDFPLAHYICMKPRISVAKGSVDVETLLGLPGKSFKFKPNAGLTFTV